MKDQFHLLQVKLAGVTLAAGLLIYTFAPADRIQLAHDVVLVSMAFLFGKFTNGWSRNRPTRWDDVKTREENDEL